MIFGHDLLLQLGFIDYFNHSVFEWYGTAVPTKLIGFLTLITVTSNITKIEMQKGVIQTAELAVVNYLLSVNTKKATKLDFYLE